MSDDVLSALQPLVARVTQRPADELAADSRFADLTGWGSFAAMHLLAAIEQTYHVRLDLRRYMKLETLGELAEEISKLLP